MGSARTAPDRVVTGTLPLVLDSGPGPVSAPPRGGPLRVRPKGLARHVAEVDALVSAPALTEIIGTSRAAIATRLHLARLEVELNVARSTTQA